MFLVFVSLSDIFECLHVASLPQKYLIYEESQTKNANSINMFYGGHVAHDLLRKHAQMTTGANMEEAGVFK